MDFAGKNIVIATHYLVYGAPQALREYLMQNKVGRLTFIGHPIKTPADDRSYVEVARGNTIWSKRHFPFRTGSLILNILLDSCLTLFWFLTHYKAKVDVFFGVNNFNAFWGIILRALGFVDKVVFYTIDYVPERFESFFLNELYHLMDKFCVTYADETWNVSRRIGEGREKIRGLSLKKYKKQKVVPIGIWFDRVKRVPFEEVKTNQLLFLGHIIEHQGIQLVLRAMPKILKEIPDFHFLIIGGGPYEATLKRLATKLKIKKHITFTGWVKERERIDAMLADSAVAIATYNKEKDKFTYYADPTKLKDYLSAGLPILLTDVPHNAYDIEKAGAGKVIEYDVESLTQNILALMKSKRTVKKYRENAISYIKPFEWTTVFEKAFSTL